MKDLNVDLRQKIIIKHPIHFQLVSGNVLRRYAGTPSQDQQHKRARNPVAQWHHSNVMGNMRYG